MRHGPDGGFHRFQAAVGGLLVLLMGCDASSDGEATGAGGPALEFSETAMRQSLVCESGLRDAQREPILLIHGTTVTPEANFDWNYMPALRALGWPFCTIALPNQAMSDIQESAEYVVFALREMHRLSGRKIQVVGHSQGGHVVRWALRWWPDTRALVDDVIGLAAPNHGTLVVAALCLPNCAPAIWQQGFNSNYMVALNSSRETFPGISYTAVYTHTDEFVQPNLDASGTTSLDGGVNVTNIATQDICPINIADHLAIGTSDPVAYAITMDALTHDGPADPTRVDPSVCTQFLMPGVNPATYPIDQANLGVMIAGQLVTYPHVAAEPPLKCYVTGTCP